ncbi:hypothetical protein HDU85_003983 [Gaertneriomyces sp. JEL0708]|nr:hypothetical protein HDU85_003983 [Gaertneriomyces sp. JEL0708]
MSHNGSGPRPQVPVTSTNCRLDMESDLGLYPPDAPANSIQCSKVLSTPNHNQVDEKRKQFLMTLHQHGAFGVFNKWKYADVANTSKRVEALSVSVGANNDLEEEEFEEDELGEEEWSVVDRFSQAFPRTSSGVPGLASGDEGAGGMATSQETRYDDYEEMTALIPDLDVIDGCACTYEQQQLEHCERPVNAKTGQNDTSRTDKQAELASDDARVPTTRRTLGLLRPASPTIKSTSLWDAYQNVEIRRLVAGRRRVVVFGIIVGCSPPKPARNAKREENPEGFVRTFWIKDSTGVVCVKVFTSEKELHRYQCMTIGTRVEVRTTHLHIRRVPPPTPASKNNSSFPFSSAIEIRLGSSGKDSYITAFDETACDYPVDWDLIHQPLLMGRQMLREVLVPLKAVKEGTRVLGVVTEVRKEQLIPFPALSLPANPKLPVIIRIRDRQVVIDMCLWSEQAVVFPLSEFIPKRTVLLITNPKVVIYRQEKTIQIGYNTMVEIDPLCEEVDELLKSGSAAADSSTDIALTKGMSTSMPVAGNGEKAMVEGPVSAYSSATLHRPRLVTIQKLTRIIKYGSPAPMGGSKYRVRGVLTKFVPMHLNDQRENHDGGKPGMWDGRTETYKIDVVDETGTLHSPGLTRKVVENSSETWEMEWVEVEVAVEQMEDETILVVTNIERIYKDTD